MVQQLETQDALMNTSVTPIPEVTPAPTPEPTPEPMQTPAIPTPEVENVQEDVFVEQTTDAAIDSDQPADEGIMTEALQTDVQLPDVPAADVPAMPGPQTERIDTSFIGTNLRNSMRTYEESIAKSSLQDGFSIKQARPLSKREGITDYFGVNIANVSNGEVDVTVQPYGAKAAKGQAGDTTPRQRRVSRQRLAQGVETGLNYVANFNRLDSRGQVVGGFEAFFDAIDPFFGNEDRPSFSLAGRNTDAIGIAQEVADSFNLYGNWDRLNDAQRFRGTANQLVQMSRELGFRLPQTATNSLGLLNFGFSAHNLMNNWNEMSEAQRVFGTINTINAGTQAYTAGASLFGSGAASAGAAGTAGAGAGTGAGAEAGVGAGAGASFATYAGYAAALYGAYNIIDQWGTGGADGRANGAANGAAVGSVFGPWGTAIGAVVGLALGSIKTGKSAEQGRRDAYRGHYEKNGLFEKVDGSHMLQLADGSFYNVGVDGSKGRASFNGQVKTHEDPSRLSEDVQRRLSQHNNEVLPYDIDGSNDLDFHTGVATQTLTFIMNGGSNYESGEAGQMNGYMANAATSNIGSREFTAENWNKSMENVRTFFGKIGIENREQALNYIEELKKRRRLSTHDYNTARLGIEYAFEENSFERAQKVNEEIGRTRPLEQVNHAEQQAEFDRVRAEGRAELEEMRRAEEERQRALQEVFG